MWKAYVDVFTALLLTSDERVGTAEDVSPAGERLHELGREAGSLRTIMCFAHPTRYIGYTYGMGQVQRGLFRGDLRFTLSPTCAPCAHLAASCQNHPCPSAGLKLLY